MSPKKKVEEWVKIVKQYQRPSFKPAIWQVITTSLPFVVLFIAMAFAVRVSYWLMFPFAVLAAGFQVRLFIIQHDCGHNSFFPSKKANDTLGNILGIFTLTPYIHWRKSHAIHHATAGDLDFRGVGDVETITVNEFYSLKWYRRLLYRIYRNPIFMFAFAPSFLFMILQRLPFGIPRGWKRERWSVHKTNAGIAAFVLLVGWAVGYKNFLMIYVTTTAMASSAGLWLFWVQHQFEETYWRWHVSWDYKEAALKGASFLKLPKILQWFTGNIGFHHIHHLAPRIPNYLLEVAYKENELFQNVTTLTLWQSFRSMFLHLWDEETDKLVTFWKARRLRKQVMRI